MATIDVNYDRSDLTYIRTQSHGWQPTVEFDLTVSSEELGLSDYQTIGYCVENYQGIGTKSYEFDMLSLSEVGNDVLYSAAWLLNEFVSPAGRYQSAALQGLIWQTVHDDQGFSVTNTNQIGTYYDNYSSALNSVEWTEDLRVQLGASYMFAQSDTYQDLIVELPNSAPPAPEPATMLLFGGFS